MEISRYIDPTKTRGKKKQAVKLSSLCLLLERQPPIFLFDAKTYQPAADASNECYNNRFQPIRVQPIRFPEQKIRYSCATCEEQNHQHPICTTFKKASSNGKTNSSSTKPMLTTSEYLKETPKSNLVPTILFSLIITFNH